jgi:acyl dehydratase
MDAASARARGFEDRVAHGALLVGLVSGVIGTQLPGPRGVLHSVEMKYKHPCLVGQRVTVVVKVIEKFESVRTLVLKVVVWDNEHKLLANGRIQSGVTGPTGA